MSIKGNPFWARKLLAVLVVAACSGCSLLPQEDEPLKPPLVKPVKENYEIAEVKVGSATKRITGVATVESTNVKNHEFTGTTGKIQEVLVVKDMTVKKGDPLIILDAGDSAIVLKEKQRDYEQAKYNLDQAKLTQDPNKMKIRVMEMDIAELRLSDARKALEGKTMRAQMDGKVTFVEASKPGDTIQQNKTYVIISDPNSIRLAYSSGNTSDMLEVQVGVPVDVTVKGKKLTGTVVQSPSNTPATDVKALADRYAKTVFIDVGSPIPELTLGATADINIVTRKKDNVLLVPQRALAQYLGRNYVKVLDGDSIKEVDVEKGLETADGVEIVKGLKEGQKLILQ
ncbi:efflux RND transporter periplasmic adaptor subunit [Paenibacillus ginsengarvi]|uniref:efflux RND transporter periplasmic adaptor subunit n=1 Tax=Paenibacillus ginsengarvi TaxID=400777 RepID=UPI0013150B31|nr:biotin/lipoyl-binding protein [Paenibacillus ginsengarvi]